MASDWHRHFVRQVDYQVWANQVMFDSLARLRPAALESPEGLFFNSIHHTVDHLLVVLEVWAARLRGEHPAVDFKVVRHPVWAELKQALQHELRQFRHWLEQQSEGFFYRRIEYFRGSGERHENEVADILNHLMMHFVHHRGQISAVATRLGAPAPEMDFIYYVRAMEQTARSLQQQQQQQ